MNQVDDWYLKRDLDNVEIMSMIVARALKNVRSTKVQTHKESMTPARFFENFGIIKIKLGRGMGHSTFAALMLYAHRDALVFVRNAGNKCGMRDLIRGFDFINTPDQAELMTRVAISGDTSMRNIRPVRNRSVIIIDQASFFSEEAYQSVLENFGNAELVVELQ